VQLSKIILSAFDPNQLLQPSISQTESAGFYLDGIDRFAHLKNQRPVIFRQQISAEKMVLARSNKKRFI